MGLVLVKPTSIANSGGSASLSGGAVTFTGVSSVSLNGVFSAAYQNYVFITNLVGSTQSQLNFRLRLAGTDNSSANYFWQGLYAQNTTVSADKTTSGTFTRLGEHQTVNSIYQVLVADPFTVTDTRTRGYNAPNGTFYDISGGFASSTSFDGFSIIPGSGNITGTIRVYGYNNG